MKNQQRKVNVDKEHSTIIHLIQLFNQLATLTNHLQKKDSPPPFLTCSGGHEVICRLVDSKSDVSMKEGMGWAVGLGVWTGADVAG